MLKIKAILFDWGGTLASVRGEKLAWWDCAAGAIGELTAGGCQFPDGAVADLMEAYTAARTESMADPLHKELDLEQMLLTWLSERKVSAPDRTTLEAALHAFWTQWTHCLDLLDDADVVLARLRHRGVETGLVSNVAAPGAYCIAQLRRQGLFEHLSTLTFSSEVGFRKPHQAIYEDALEKMRPLFDRRTLFSEEVMFVGDSPVCDITGPAQLGMPTALMIHPGIESPWLAVDYTDVKPTYRIAHLRELETILHPT